MNFEEFTLTTFLHGIKTLVILSLILVGVVVAIKDNIKTKKINQKAFVFIGVAIGIFLIFEVVGALFYVRVVSGPPLPAFSETNE